MPTQCNQAQCQFEWNNTTNQWDQIMDCTDFGTDPGQCSCGADPPQSPLLLGDPSEGITVTLGDIWITPCEDAVVVPPPNIPTATAKPKAKAKPKPKRSAKKAPKAKAARKKKK